MDKVYEPLAVVLYAGEPSLPTAISSIESQAGIVPRFILIGNHPKHQAHERLFRLMTDYRTEHDFFIFLGADMSLAAPRLLLGLGTIFDEFPRLDHILLGVNDWYSGEHQLGVNIWRRGVAHGSSPNRLFTDLASSTSRTRLKIERPRSPLILHGIDPSDRQAVRYGAQRGMKAAASGKQSRWDRLATLIDFAAADPAPQRLLALAGVKAALTDRSLGDRCIASTVSLSDDDLRTLQESARSAGLIDELRELVADVDLRVELSAERHVEVNAVPRKPRRLRERLHRGRAGRVDLQAAEERLFAVLDDSKSTAQFERPSIGGLSRAGRGRSGRAVRAR